VWPLSALGRREQCGHADLDELDARLGPKNWRSWPAGQFLISPVPAHALFGRGVRRLKIPTRPQLCRREKETTSSCSVLWNPTVGRFVSPSWMSSRPSGEKVLFLGSMYDAVPHTKPCWSAGRARSRAEKEMRKPESSPALPGAHEHHSLLPYGSDWGGNQTYRLLCPSRQHGRDTWKGPVDGDSECLYESHR